MFDLKDVDNVELEDNETTGENIAKIQSSKNVYGKGNKAGVGREGKIGKRKVKIFKGIMIYIVAPLGVYIVGTVLVKYFGLS